MLDLQFRSRFLCAFYIFGSVRFRETEVWLTCSVQFGQNGKTLLWSVTTSSMGGCISIRELYSEWLLFIELQCHAQNSITWGCRRIFSHKLFWLALEIDWNPFWRCNLISVCLGIFWRFSLYKVHNMASMRIFLWKSRYFAWRHSISKVSSRNSKMKLLWAEYTAPSKASTQHRHDQVWLLLNDCWTSFPIIISDCVTSKTPPWTTLYEDKNLIILYEQFNLIVASKPCGIA